MGLALDGEQALGVGEQVDRIVRCNCRCGPLVGQGCRDVVLHQLQLAKSAERKGIAGLEHHCLLQRALGSIGIVVP